MSKIHEVLCLIILVSVTVLSAGAMLISEYNTQMELPYYMVLCTSDGFQRWDKPIINISASGDMTPFDWYCIEDIIDEWNTKVAYPKLGYNSKQPDIEIMFDRYEDEQWAGCAWVTSSAKNNKVIEHGYIKIRTSWNYNREHVIRHELGHIMGLGYHSNHPDSTMYNWASGVSEWSYEDLQVIQWIYSNEPGACKPSPDNVYNPYTRT